MRKKKVAILLPWLKMGGTNKVALRFMKQLVDYYDVTLVLSQNSGELLDEVPEGVNIIIDHMSKFKDIVKEDIKKLRIPYIIKDIIYYANIKFHNDNIDNYKYLVSRHENINDEQYDCAISYHGQSPERLLNLIYRIHANTKIAWIHGEISFSDNDCKLMEKYYSKLDRFFFVSNPTMQSFQNKIHIASENCTVYYNPINKSEILRLSNAKTEDEFSNDWINLLTVGRISAEKGQDMIPEITRNLIDMGHKIRWYIIGDGDMHSKVESLIQKYKVENNVFLLGVKTNPYCYMRNCDIYIQPSYTEGYSTTICEAGIIGKAIIGTESSGGIRDQITNGKDGLIVPATVDGLCQGILKLLDDKNLQNEFENQIQKKDFEGKGEINKFLKLV